MLLDYPTGKLQPSFAAVFAQGLTDPARAPPGDVVGPRGKAAIKRYNVYRNNVTVSLINALAATYPAVQRITGVELHDYGCTLKAYRGDLARRLMLYGEMHRFVPAIFCVLRHISAC